MAVVNKEHGKGAHYHAVKATAAWQAFVQGTADAATDAATKRQRRRLQRQRETTYAKGVTGSH